ncbi:hypothetical protein FACS1894168_2070 [Deltaproteobacteria bacterium]|nr:hypothetical protein FACS1894168_2070 [Deltaproteobacteria bacterium]
MAAKTKSKGSGAIFLALFVLLAVAGGSAWFIHSILPGENGGSTATQARGEGTEANSAGQASSEGKSLLSDVTDQIARVVQGLGNTLQPDQNTQAKGAEKLPETQPGIAGGQVYGVPAGSGNASGGGNAGNNPADNLLLAPGAIATPPPAAREDAVVRPAFVTDMAAFLAQNYWPKNTHPAAKRSGITTVSLRWANLRYGAELRAYDGNRDDPGKVRSAILEYILSPAVIGRIYNLYADDFVAVLSREAAKRTVGEGSSSRSLAGAEKKEMFTIYASYASRVAGALEAYAADPAMAARVVAYAEAENAAQAANRSYMESMIVYEEALEGNNAADTDAARLRRDKDAALYQKRIREREGKYNALFSAMTSRFKNPPAEGKDTIIYVAFWAYRRGANSAAALQICAKALSDMGAKLASAAPAQQ